MPTRRQEKINRIIKEVVADAIQNRLSDPRIEGIIISVTQTDVAPDLRTAEVYLSIMSEDEQVSNKAFKAIRGAAAHIRRLLSDKLTTRFTPELRFHRDIKIKGAIETLKVIEEAAKEFKEEDELNAPEDESTDPQ
ncbi:Ribosome-binding factor A [Anaerohalosphaera lusitana]|uniref:Ribosome-binding factor A n=1 Tax=Anaerohalosphaera lusitana TaxID=1936003 RepID=A0A1U9NIL5_9BACT|nr:30S ribosome-binding factor RbfA [Anaerohalosphaera lusitana]AQT67665.1 Ribosome-binding factor A [Anaerohalosphaera lusitana]